MLDLQKVKGALEQKQVAAHSFSFQNRIYQVERASCFAYLGMNNEH